MVYYKKNRDIPWYIATFWNIYHGIYYVIWRFGIYHGMVYTNRYVVYNNEVYINLECYIPRYITISLIVADCPDIYGISQDLVWCL